MAMLLLAIVLGVLFLGKGDAFQTKYSLRIHSVAYSGDCDSVVYIKCDIRVIVFNLDDSQLSYIGTEDSNESFQNNNINVHYYSNKPFSADSLFKIIVYDEDIGGRHLEMHGSIPLEVLSDGRPLFRSSLVLFTVEPFVTITYTVYVDCGRNYFGPKCETYCVDEPGIFTCNLDGSKNCTVGSKDACKVIQIDSNNPMDCADSQSHLCDDDGHKVCKQGYFGDECTSFNRCLAPGGDKVCGENITCIYENPNNFSCIDKNYRSEKSSYAASPIAPTPAFRSVPTNLFTIRSTSVPVTSLRIAKPTFVSQGVNSFISAIYLENILNSQETKEIINPNLKQSNPTNVILIAVIGSLLCLTTVVIIFARRLRSERKKVDQSLIRKRENKSTSSILGRLSLGSRRSRLSEVRNSSSHDSQVDTERGYSVMMTNTIPMNSQEDDMLYDTALGLNSPFTARKEIDEESIYTLAENIAKEGAYTDAKDIFDEKVAEDIASFTAPEEIDEETIYTLAENIATEDAYTDAKDIFDENIYTVARDMFDENVYTVAKSIPDDNIYTAAMKDTNEGIYTAAKYGDYNIDYNDDYLMYDSNIALLLTDPIYSSRIEELRQDEIYEGHTEESLYAELISLNSVETVSVYGVDVPLSLCIDDACLSSDELLGYGQFGTVVRGTLKYNDNTAEQQVAIKQVCVASASIDNIAELVREGVLQATLTHPNIMRCLGIVAKASDGAKVVLQLAANGSIRSYLRNMLPLKLPTNKLISMSYDIASAVAFLHMKHIIHRDLAARNVLLDSDGICKLADFGLSRQTDDYEIYTSQASGESACVPVRWLSPEALLFRHFSKSSDSYSFGVLMWELFSYCNRPFSQFNNKEFLQEFLKRGRIPRLLCPENCPLEIYSMILILTENDPRSRTKVIDVESQLKSLLENNEC